MNQNLITSEEQYVDILADLAKNAKETNSSLLSENSKNEITIAKKNIVEYLSNNIKDDDTFLVAYDLWNKYQNSIKHAICQFIINGLELKVIHNTLHRDVEYTTETLFYGLHLKKYFLNKFPKSKTEFEEVKSEITFSQSVALHHVLSTVKVKGLNKENFALAHVLFKLSEISKIYQDYETISAKINDKIRTWSMGLDNKVVEDLQNAVKETVTTE